MTGASPAEHAGDAKAFLHRLLILAGNSLTAIGCLGLMLHAGGSMTAHSFFAGASLGIRGIGAVAITGCLLSAVGYGIVDYLEK